MRFRINDFIEATRQITEGGNIKGRIDVSFPDPAYIHAEKGETGRVIHITKAGMPTIRFERTGSITIVGKTEVKKLEI
jgi:hypothetical protein